MSDILIQEQLLVHIENMKSPSPAQTHKMPGPADEKEETLRRKGELMKTSISFLRGFGEKNAPVCHSRVNLEIAEWRLIFVVIVARPVAFCSLFGFPLLFRSVKGK